MKKYSLFPLTLTLALLVGSAVPTSACTPASNSSGNNLEADIKSLACSDVENDIPRRTEFIIKIYTDSKKPIDPVQITKTYEKAYFEQINQKLPQSLLKNPATRVGFSILGALVGGVFLGVFSRELFGLRTTKVEVTIPFGIGKLELSVDSAAKKAAWLLYVELATRIATQPLRTNEGLLREALDSLHGIFEMTRQILRDAGPDVGMAENSVGGIAMKVLNEGLRPFLAKWHPALEEWEAQRPETSSRKAHEQQWTKNNEMRDQLDDLRTNLVEYAVQLAKIAKR
ncbi:MAG: hypothetical protein ACK507_00250 [bacterium]|jgi:hypothetical protein